MLGASILTLIGDTELFGGKLPGNPGIYAGVYSSAGEAYQNRIEGCCLKIVYYTNEDMKIAGKISGVRYL